MRLPSLLRALLQHPSTNTPQQEPGMAAAPARETESMLARVALECGGDISASQEEVLGGDNALAASDEEEEVFATPPDATQQQQDSVTMCTLPFTPTPSKKPKPPSGDAHAPLSPSDQPHSPAPPLSFDAADDAPLANPSRKPRVGTRKVRGARLRTPTPSPSPSPEKQQQQPQAEEQQPVHVDPLVRAVLMIPAKTAAATTTSNPVEDFLWLCRQKGLI